MAENRSVFISATSADLKSYRHAVKEELLTKDLFPIEQTNFPPDHRAVRDMLEAKIKDCGAVICLVGFVCGAEPLHPGPELARRSYTQMEYDLAMDLLKPVYVFLAHERCPFDSTPNEEDDKKQLQLDFRAELMNRDELWYTFASLDELKLHIAHINFTSGGRRRWLYNLPYRSLGTLFKGRDDFLEKLHHELQRSSVRAAAVVQPPAACGLGGIGKTRLAVEYAWRHAGEYSALLFVIADTPENLRRNLAGLVGPLVLNLPEQTAAEEDVKVAAALRWLKEHPGWFLILDNVDTREAATAAEAVLTQLRGGHVLITSRLTEWSADVEPLELGVLDPDAARAFLLERTEGKRRPTGHDDADARALARELDGLALALEQAASYIAHVRCTLADYLKRWQAGERRVRAWHDDRLMKYPRSVAVTWDTTMQQVGVVGQALLRLLAWLAPDPIPRELLVPCFASSSGYATKGCPV